MKTKNNYLKYIVILLVIVFLISAALLLFEMWERKKSRSPVTISEDGVVTYEGKEYVRKDNIETFLVMGLDKYEGESSSDSHGSSVQADFLMLFVFDNETQQYSAIQINRDTMTTVNKLAIGGRKLDAETKQIALAYNVEDPNEKVKCRNAMDAVETLLCDIDIDHYLSLTMDSVPVMNDLVGGVEVEILDDLTGIDDTLVKGECVNLTGEQALVYVRTRYGLEDSTNSTRMARQQQYVKALHDKVLSCIEADDGFIIDMIAAMDDYMVYDSTDKRMQKFAEKFEKYEFLGIREIEGENELGEEFIEFYPDINSIWEIVIDLFYEPKTNG